MLLLPVALLAAAACDDNNSNGSEATEEPTTVATDAEAPEEPTSEASNDDGDTGDESGVFGAVNPFNVLDGIGGAPANADVSPELEAALLTAGDLPEGFLDMGTFGYALPSELGEIQMAGSMFVGGDLMSGDFSAMVLSAAMDMPPEALEDLDQFEITEDDLSEIEGLAGDAGALFSNLEILDASGLGDAGFGMHMTMDVGSLLGDLAASEPDNPFADGISMDMYGFVQGDHLLMVMVMWPASQDSGVDGHDLAALMEAKS
jgi:hypothetical protein